ncbi:MAG TPA: aminotransferase class V-fold PLP-dependent enzyme, partial [Vicinamibacteria bacterium]|nr:aminotransferase class V-fold PLP-dependent enzyme [Vicinamibacteria bacterium]
MDRRGFLMTTGISLAAGALARPAWTQSLPSARAAVQASPSRSWAWVRDQFAVARDLAHFSAFYITSHPRPVRNAIEELRRALDENPFETVEQDLFRRPDEVRAAAAEYLGGRSQDVALTRCTTEGLALVYSGLRLKPGQEILTTLHDHYSHHESIRLAARRTGAEARRVALYDTGSRARADEVVDRLRRAIRPATRVVGVTWVHSSTGVKLPLRAMASVVAEANRSREASDRVLLVVDGVHGFGVEDEAVAEIGCDFFAAGAHKWIFGPRGTGILWGRREAWEQIQPTVPAFEMGPYVAWGDGRDPGVTEGRWVSPGGFHAYEHMWALPAAFAFHREIGRSRIAARIHELNARIKEGLGGLRRVAVHTPREADMSAG